MFLEVIITNQGCFMNKVCLFLCSLSLTVMQLSAQQSETEDKTTQIGRYQIAASDSEQKLKTVYLLDTANGTVWILKENYSWGNPYYDGWTKLPPLPADGL